MARAAILPSNMVDPNGVDRLERGAMAEFARRLQRIRLAYVAALNRLQYEVVEELEVNASKYVFRLDQQILNTIFGDTDAMVDQLLMEGGQENWFFTNFVQVAYQQGTARTYANLAMQSDVYVAGRRNLAEVLRSPPYVNRIALVRAREFEEMKGLASGVKADMSRVLSNGIAMGENPLAIARKLKEQTGIEIRRANRIARTEVGQALRTARLDEKDDAARTYGVKSAMLHLSALSPTTRPTHSARHGKLYTSDQVRLWYTVDGNAINCKCAQTEVILGDNGKPLVPSVIERALRQKEIVEARSK